LHERDDFGFFAVLYKKLEDIDVCSFGRISTFFKVTEEVVKEYYHIKVIVRDFDEIAEKFKTYVVDGINETAIKIEKSFMFLAEYCLMNNIVYKDLFIGSPPLILRKWKEGYVDEHVVVYLYDFNKIKKKTWYRIYCGKLANSQKKISESINNSVYLTSLMEDELLKLKSSICKIER